MNKNIIKHLNNLTWLSPLGLLVIIILTTLIYSRAFNSPLVFDSLYHINAGLDGTLKNFSLNGVRWVSAITLACTWHFVQGATFWYHVGNLFIHLANACLVYVFLKNLFIATLADEKKYQVNNKLLPLTALFAAFMFALNPVAVYATAYIIQRSTLLAVFFALLSFLAYLRGLQNLNLRWFWVTALLYFLSLHAKEHALMLPAVYLALTLLLRQPSFLLAKKLLLPFVSFALIALYVVLKQKSIIGGVFEPLTHTVVQKSGTGFTAAGGVLSLGEAKIYALSVINQGSLFFKYFFLWFVPYTKWISICTVPPFPTQLVSWPASFGFAAFCLYPVIAISLLFKRGMAGLLGFGLIFPWLMFFTEFSLVRFHESFVLYRAYIWFAGAYAVLPFVFKVLPRIVGAVLILLVLLTYPLMTNNRVATFTNPLLVWRDAVEKTEMHPDKTYPLSVYRIFSNYATYLSVSGYHDEAVKYYLETIRINPQRYQAYHSISDIFASQKKYAEAFKYIFKVIEISPDYAEGYHSLARLYSNTNQRERAIANYLKALNLKKELPSAHYNLANDYSAMGDVESAERHFKEAIKQDPSLRDAHYNLGNLYLKSKAFDQAILAFQKTINIDPAYIGAHHNLAVAFIQKGEIERGVATLKGVLKIDPNYGPSKRLFERFKKGGVK
ncbi:MAG: tetratricopeptide repeat protein [Deltaproteobacteria bacterium]|nr:tetratricopeptide repeat protein [Deltaproteobacteria bacterium]